MLFIPYPAPVAFQYFGDGSNIGIANPGDFGLYTDDANELSHGIIWDMPIPMDF